MSGFTKLSPDIVDSSIWDEDAYTCKVWVTLLALANRDGYVRGSVGWLAKKAKVAVEVCQKAVNIFISPDYASRTPDNEGRRVELLSDGFLILNYLRFRGRLSDDPDNRSSRMRMQKHREKHRTSETVTDRNVTPCDVTSVTLLLPLPLSSASEEGKGGVGEGEAPLAVTPEQIYDAYPLKVGRPKALQAIRKAIQRGASPEFLMARAKLFSETRSGNLEFCPHPSTWFNQDRYNDDVKTWGASSPTTAIKAPTLAEVKLCAAKTGLPESDAVWFWHKGESDNWTKIGQKWPHTIAAWKAAGYMPSQKARNGDGQHYVNGNGGRDIKTHGKPFAL